MGRTSSFLLGGALALFLGSASGQDSCVQVSNASFVASCPCDAGSELTFQIVGETAVAANKVSFLGRRGRIALPSLGANLERFLPGGVAVFL